jgi:hypothetical protein
MAYYSNTTGNCSLSDDRLMADSGMSATEVADTIRWLEDGDLIASDRKMGVLGRWTGRYHLNKHLDYNAVLSLTIGRYDIYNINNIGSNNKNWKYRALD